MKDSPGWVLTPAHRITEEQYLKILEAARTHRDWMLLFLPGNLGLRISEVLHFRVSDFDHGSGLVRIVRRKKKKLAEEGLEVSNDVFPLVAEYVKKASLKPGDWLFQGKCGPCYRTVRLSEKLPDGTRKRWKERQKLCGGGHLTVRRAEAVWDRVLDRLGLKVPRRGIHTLRHYAATRYYFKTRDLRATQKFLGHTSPLVTQAYADVVEMKERANAVGISVAGASKFGGEVGRRREGPKPPGKAR